MVLHVDLGIGAVLQAEGCCAGAGEVAGEPAGGGRRSGVHTRQALQRLRGRSPVQHAPATGVGGGALMSVVALVCDRGGAKLPCTPVGLHEMMPVEHYGGTVDHL